VLQEIKSEVPPAVVEYANRHDAHYRESRVQRNRVTLSGHPLDLLHSGGTMPFLLSRFTRHEIDMKEKANERVPKGVMSS